MNLGECGNLDLLAANSPFQGIAARSDVFNFGAISQALKALTPRLMLSICILSGVLLFSPAQLTAALGLASVMSTNRPWIALAFLGSGSLLLGHGAFEFLPKWTQAIRFRIRRRRRAKYLTVDERRVMQGYILNKSRTQRFNADSGVISGLMAYGFVGLASTQGNFLGFPFNITNWAYRYFSKHPDLIETPGIKPFDPLEGIP